MIRQHLYNCPEFTNEYTITSVEQNYQLIWGRQNFLDNPDRFECLTECDLFIHQPLNDTYGGNATSTLLPYLKSTTQQITIPYIWNTAFWPLPKAHLADTTDNLHVVSKPVIKNKGAITSLVDQGLSYSDIVHLYDSNSINFNYKSRWDKILKVLQLKEQHTDVKVFDFIVSNYKKHKLFVDPSHPTSILVKYMVDQILTKLGFSTYTYDKVLKTEISYNNIPYDKSARDFFGFEFLDDDELDSQFYKNLIEQVITNYQNA